MTTLRSDWMRTRGALWRRGCFTVLALTASIGMLSAQPQWTERTILTFSEPVLVPGATLQPGTYVFRLANSNANRHIVRITRQDTSDVVALTQAVPMKRLEPKGDVVLKFSPNQPGSPPAIRGWFYPGSLYGHEFIYPEEQARDIANRTKTIVLSSDVVGSDLEKGTLYAYRPSGGREMWRADSRTVSEWREWEQGHRKKTGDGENVASRAPMIQTTAKGMQVRLDALEDNALKYIGQTVSVDAEVDRVIGPRLFTIDEPMWADLEGEILVLLPNTYIAPVKEGDRVTVTGTVKSFANSEVEGAWGWRKLEPDAERSYQRRPILVASQVAGGGARSAMIVSTSKASSGDRKDGADAVVGTSGNMPTLAAPLTDAAAIARGDEALVGRFVNLKGVSTRSSDGRGFFITTTDGSIFVLASEMGSQTSATPSQPVTGMLLQMPRDMEDRLTKPSDLADLNDELYIYALQNLPAM